MTAYRQTLAALAGVALIAGGTTIVGHAQQAAAPTAPRPLISPVRGEAVIGYTKPVVKNTGKQIITTIQVKNLSKGPIAGFKVDEFWYDKAGGTVSGSPTFRLRKPLMPGEVVDVLLTVPVVPGMTRSNYKFEHANGAIKATLIPKI